MHAPLKYTSPFGQELRHRCRNQRCRSKLKEPVSNPHRAFCCKGCHSSFYLHRCLICERPIDQPKGGGRRSICNRATCRNARRYHISSAVKPFAKEADFIGVKAAPKAVGAWRTIVGPELTPTQFHCAAVGAEKAVQAINRTNLKHWHEANSKAEAGCSIKRHDQPINFPLAHKISRPAPLARQAARPNSLIPDDLAIPKFLSRVRGP